jgi:type II secretory pathway component PulM
VKQLLEQLQKLWADRSPRERWIIVIAACVIGLWAVDSMIATPLQERIARVEGQIQAAEADSVRASLIAQRLYALRGELAAVEEQIQPGAETNLLALIESLAAEAGIREQLQAIKPRQGSRNEQYPETRVEVSLKGASLEQTVKLLHAIENAPLHLMVRSVRIRALRALIGKVMLLDVSFFVSSFARA